MNTLSKNPQTIAAYTTAELSAKNQGESYDETTGTDFGSSRPQGITARIDHHGRNDVLRDEDEEYARSLMQAGVDMTVVRYLATFRDFVTLKVLADTPTARSTISLAIQNLRESLRTIDD
jgi:acetyl esterase/lipase